MGSSSFLTLCLNPTLQKTLSYPKVVRDTVNRTSNHRLDASGKGINVTRVLDQLGKTVVHLTHLGGVNKSLFLELCSQDDLRIRWEDSGSDIRFCYTVLDGSDRSVTELVEEAKPVAAGTEARILGAFRECLPPDGTFIVSGTRAGGYSDALIPGMVKEARERGLRIILDVRGQDLINSLPFKPDILKPNLSEFVGTFFKSPPADEGELRSAVVAKARELSIAHGCAVVMTRGARSVWTVQGEDFREYAFQAVPPVNTIGSGDAFTAGLAAALDSGADLPVAIGEGARCGRLNAQLLRPGVIR